MQKKRQEELKQQEKEGRKEQHYEQKEGKIGQENREGVLEQEEKEEKLFSSGNSRFLPEVFDNNKITIV